MPGPILASKVDSDVRNAKFFEDLSLNLYPPDYRYHTDNDPADLSDLEKQELGIDDIEQEDEEDKQD